MAVSHLSSDVKYKRMPRKIFVYGDSFTTPANCRTTCEHMWYRYVSDENRTAVVVNRARSGNNTAHMFLEATHDCLTNERPVDLLIGLGPLQRLPKYTDGWYHEESLLPTADTTLEHCLEYMRSQTPSEMELQNTQRARTTVDVLFEMYHPTLLWANLYKNIVSLDRLAQHHGHRLLVVHMHHREFEHNKHHTLIKPLEEGAILCNYIDQLDSCHVVCARAGIRPWDYDEHGEHGHHSAEGQMFFGKHIRRLLDERTSWN
jgi:hypothetical protein